MLKILGMAAVLVKSSASFEIDCFMDTSHPMERLMSINCYQNELYQNPDVSSTISLSDLEEET